MAKRKKGAEPAREAVTLSRPAWSGSITFGLVNIPVQLFMGVRRKDVRFHLLHDKDKSRLEQKLVCPVENKEVSRSEVVKGFEIARNRHVVVEPKEIESLAPKASHTIELVSFVELNSIDPLYFDRPYYALPREHGGKAYQLLLSALKTMKKVGVGRFVMRQKEYVAVLRPIKSLLCVETLHFADEVIMADDISWQPPEAKVSPAEVKMAEELVSSLSAQFDPERFHDDYRQALMDLIRRKAEGEQVVEQPAVAEDAGPEVINLMAALQKSLQEVKRHKPRQVA